MSDSINEDEPNIVEEGVEVEEDVEEKDKDVGDEGADEGADEGVEEDVEDDPVKLPLSLEDVDVPFYPGEIQEDVDEDKIPVLDEGEEEEVEVEEEGEEEDKSTDKVVQDYSHKMLEFNTDFNIGDLFLIIFFDKKKYTEYLGNVTEIQENYFVLNNEKNIYYSSETNEIQLVHEEYTIIDISKILEVKTDVLEKDGEIFKEEGIELMVDEKSRKEKVYTITEIKEDFISEIINLYDIYDNELLIKNITEMAYSFIDLIEENKITHEIDDTDVLEFVKELIKNNSFRLPSYILPIVSLKKKLFNSTNPETEETYNTTIEEELVRIYNLLNDNDDFSSKEYINYMNNLFNEEFNSYINDLSNNGFTINYKGHIIKNCFNDINPCNGEPVPYTVDLLKVRNNLMLNLLISDSSHPPLVFERGNVVDERYLNITGFLFIPINHIKSIENLDINNNLFNLNELIDLSNKNIILLKNIILNEEIILNNITEDSVKNENYEKGFNKYLFNINDKITFTDFKELLKKNFPTNSDIIDSLNTEINDDLKLYDLIYNYDNLEKLLNLYGMSKNDIKYDKKVELNKIIEGNIKTYNNIYKKLLKKYIKPIKELKVINKELDSKDKIKLCTELIFSQKDLVYRNNLLHKFISLYGRDANKESEDKHFYYNIYADSEKLICKHYLYLINVDKNAFETLKSIYGDIPKDGDIYCKKCHRFICLEDFSTFEGFNEGVPSNIREAAVDIEDELDLNKKEVKNAYDFIKNISEKFNIILKNDDMIKIIELYSSINNEDLYNYRYNKNVLKEHPYIKTLDTKDKKEFKESIDYFKEYLININRTLSAIFLIFIQIQVSNNSYNINFNNRINIINSDESWRNLHDTDNYDSINIKVIIYIEAILRSLIKKYPKDRIFGYLNDLMHEKETYNLLTFREQYINIIKYWLNPQYNLYTSLDKYFLFESGINTEYIKDSWTNYKPLYDNKLVQKINAYLNLNNELFKKYLVNNNSLQNISLLKNINNGEPKYQELHITLSEIMNNPSFKRLYNYSLKLYGKSEVFPLLNLLTEQFINTFTQSGRKDIIQLLNKCHYNHETKKYSSIHYDLFKKVFLEDIINLEVKKDSDNIKKFQYINLNNNEYFLLNSKVNRHYSYIPPNVYINDSFEKLRSDKSDILDKIFKYYCLDKKGNLIPNLLNDNMINYFLIDFNEELQENLSECKKVDIPKTLEYFELIINYLIIKNKLSIPDNYIVYTEKYSNDYINNNIYINIDIENRLLNVINEDYINKDDIIYNNFNNIGKLIKLIIYKKTNKEIFDEEEIFNQFNILLKELIIYQKNYIDNIDKLYNNLIKNDMYLQFNDHQKNRLKFKLNKEENKTLEDYLGFIPNTNITFFMKKIIDKINDKNISDKMVNNIFYYLSVLKNNNKGDFNPNIKKDEWKMSESNIDDMKEHLSTNNLLLHNDIFFKHKMKEFEDNRVYSGFNQYRYPATSNALDAYIYFEGLYNYINKFRENIYKLKTSKDNIINEKSLEIINIFIFIYIINKITEYINSLLDDTSEIYKKENDIYNRINNDNINIDNSIIYLSRFLLDIIFNIYDKLYDKNWIYMDSETYKNKLDEHNAREKQNNLDKLDNMSDDKRKLYSVNQKIAGGVMYFESEKANYDYKNSEEYKKKTEEEKKEMDNEMFDENSVAPEDENINQSNDESNIDEEGYYNNEDIVAEGDENEDDLDNVQLDQD
jgi:hypothetical protein